MLFQDHNSNNTGRWRTGGRLRAWGACCRFFRFTVDAVERKLGHVDQCIFTWEIDLDCDRSFKVGFKGKVWALKPWNPWLWVDLMVRCPLARVGFAFCGEWWKRGLGIQMDLLCAKPFGWDTSLLRTPQMCSDSYQSEWVLEFKQNRRQSTLSVVVRHIQGVQCFLRFLAAKPSDWQDEELGLPEARKTLQLHFERVTRKGKKTRLKRQPNQRRKSWLGCGSRTERRFRTCYRPTFWNSERPT